MAICGTTCGYIINHDLLIKVGMISGEASNTIPTYIKRSIFLWWGVGLGIWFTYQFAQTLKGLLIQILLALFLSFAMDPIVERLNKRGLKRGISTAIAMLAILGFFIIFFAAMGNLIITQLNDLVEDLPSYANSIQIWADSRFDYQFNIDDFVEEIQSDANSYVEVVATNALGVSTFAVSFLFQVLTVSLFAFYLTADGPRLRKNICSILPPAKQHEVLRIWEVAIEKTGAYISSRIILAIGSTIFHWIVFSLLGLPSALALALWVGIISQFIPIIGTYIAGVLPVLIGLANNPATVIWVLAAILLYQQIENYLLQPRITAQTLNMHPAIAFGGVIAGGSLLGATGAVLALPFIATVQSFVSVYIERHNVIESDFLNETKKQNIEVED